MGSVLIVQGESEGARDDSMISTSHSRADM